VYASWAMPAHAAVAPSTTLRLEILEFMMDFI
jgi:hypothetical protein